VFNQDENGEPLTLEQLLSEIREAPANVAFEGGSHVLVAIGAAILDRVGYHAEGKASVMFEIDEDTRIVISWRGED
jgi:hypothetical protein